MKRKIKNRSGFTLAEALMVIVILSLVTAAGAVGISNIMAERIVMVQAADADILGSTAFQAIANEVRFGQNIKVSADGTTIQLDSMNYGPDTKILLTTKDKETTVFAGEHKLLSDHAHGGLEIKELSFTPNKEGEDANSPIVSITISMAISGYRGQLWHTECTVTPLNGKVELSPSPSSSPES